MKVDSLIIALFCFLNLSLINKVEEIIPVYKNGKYGYINYKGKVVIKHQYLSAYHFSKDLACARKEGLFGYINRKGEWVIQPQYDFGTAFSKGAALVWVDAKPQLINNKGKVIYKTNEKIKAKNIGKGLFKFSQKGSKDLLINSKGLKISKNNIFSVTHFVNDKAVVYTKGKSISKVGRYYHNAGLIDQKGKILIDFGKYYAIFNYPNEQISAAIANKDGSFMVHYFDKNLNIIARIKSSYVGRPHQGFSEGLKAINITAPPLNSSENDYQGYINPDGDTLINNENHWYVNPFKDGVATVMDHNHERFIINSKGKRLSNNTYFNFLRPYSINQRLFAIANNYWKIIKPNEEVIYTLDKEYLFEELIDDKYLIYTRKRGRFNYKNNTNEDVYISGLMDLNGNIIIKAENYLRIHGKIGNSVIYATNDKYQLFYNLDGIVIYKVNKSTKSNTNNIDYKARVYYSVKLNIHKSDLDGFAKSDNHSSSIENIKEVKDGTLGIIYKPDTKNKNLIIYNKSGETKFFSGINSCLYLCLEAKNKEGKWQPIEMYPRSFCGNSYHTLQLPNNEQWSVNTKKYEGVFETKLRYALKVLEAEPKKRSWEKPNSYSVYSKEFKGSINPAQFWRIKPYSNMGIMDAGY